MVRRNRMTAAVLLGAALSIGASSALSGSRGSASEGEIRTLLTMQTEAWNRGDIDGFMEGYWKSDQTEFVGAKGVSRGWQALLDRYRRDYPDQKTMGQLSFANLEIHVTCADGAYAIGEFHLQRENDQPAGVFTLYFRKFPEGWRIVVDHTTVFPSTSSK